MDLLSAIDEQVEILKDVIEVRTISQRDIAENQTSSLGPGLLDGEGGR